MIMKKKIIIGYTNSKNEEKRVAKELYDYFINIKDIDVEMLDFSSCFYILDNKNILKKIYSLFSKQNNIYTDTHIQKSIKEYKPNIIITTNNLIDHLINYYISINITKCKIINIVCDIQINNLNNKYSNANYYIVNNKVIKNKLISKGIPNKKIIVAGTPTYNLDKINIENKELTLKKYSLDNNKPIYLMLANGHNYTYEYFKALTKKEFNINIIFVSGKNKELKDKCEEYIFENNIKNVLILGYIKDLYNLYNISDVIITKPGTSTLIECMNFKKPTILLPGVSIDENKNLKFMIKNHLSVKVTTPNDLVKKVRLSINYKFIIKSTQNKLMKLESYNSYKIIYELIKKL